MNKKKKHIIESAHKLFLEKGFVNTSIQDILDEAKIAKGTFYNYFSSKNECLISILEYAKDESDQQRKELALGRRKDDEELFIEQVLIRLKTDKKHNLMALFSTTSIMEDKELRAFMVKQHIGEVQWIANRFMDLYGRHIREIAFDQAVMFLGILQHILQIGKSLSQKKRPLEELIWFALKQIRPLVEHQLQSKEVLFPYETKVLEETDSLKTLSEQIQKQLEGLIQKRAVPSQEELLEFLASELCSESPRIMLIESVWKTLSQSENEIEAYKDVVYGLWNFIEKAKQG